MKIKLTLLIFILFLGACSNKTEQAAQVQLAEKNKKTSVLGNRVSLLVYNVQNLFDTQHDEGKNDWTFLPKDTAGKDEQCSTVKHKYYKKLCFGTDWTKEKLNLKLNQIARVAHSIGRPIDLFGVIEIENEIVLKALAKKTGMKKYLITNSPDMRGVDVALLYNPSENLKFIDSKEHTLSGDHFNKKPTRNILEAQFKVKNKYNMFIFINHWPSQSNPSEARVEAAKLIEKRIKNIYKKYPNAHIVVTGDFNTIQRDKPHPFQDVLFKDNFLLDINMVLNNGKEDTDFGTYFYFKNKKWNQLDRILINRKLLDIKIMEVDLNSFRIHTPQFLRETKRFGDKFFNIPKGYDFKATSKEEAGFSDHFPIYVEFIY